MADQPHTQLERLVYYQNAADSIVKYIRPGTPIAEAAAAAAVAQVYATLAVSAATIAR